MTMTLIAAMGQNRVIGNDGQLPWQMPADLKYFKAQTTGKPILMGRKTYESIGRPLPGRHNIVLTRNRQFSAEGVDVIYGLKELEERVSNESEIMVIGGAQIYEQCLATASRIILTVVHGEFEGDTFFPIIDPNVWFLRDSAHHSADEQNPWNYTFYDIRRDSAFLSLPKDFLYCAPVSA